MLKLLSLKKKLVLLAITMQDKKYAGGNFTVPKWERFKIARYDTFKCRHFCTKCFFFTCCFFSVKSNC